MQAIASADDPPKPAPAGAALSAIKMKAGCWLEKVDELRDEFESFFLGQIFDGRSSVSKATLRSRDSRTIRAVIARFNPTTGVQRNRKVDCRCARDEKDKEARYRSCRRRGRHEGVLKIQ